MSSHRQCLCEGAKFEGYQAAKRGEPRSACRYNYSSEYDFRIQWMCGYENWLIQVDRMAVGL